nr:hypothetical protein [Mucilaginibacter sp. X4EP1]
MPTNFVALNMAIVKILARHNPSYKSLIQYILDEAKINKAEVYTHNLRSDTINDYVHEFIENQSFRLQSRTDQIYFFHELVSLSAKENNELITKEMIDDLVHEYIRLRGITGVMIGAVHRDKEHVHIHFCTSGLHFRTGKSFGMSKAKLHELKVSFQEYHKRKYPELTESLPEHGKGERYQSHAKWHAKQREQIIDTVNRCFAQATSQQEFLALLRDQGLHHYERNGKPTGIEYEGLKFRFSRLLPDKQFENLPVERNEEDRVLSEIQAVREWQKERDNREHDSGDRER